MRIDIIYDIITFIIIEILRSSVHIQKKKNDFRQLYPIYVHGRINILYDLPPIDEEESIDTSGYRLL